MGRIRRHDRRVRRRAPRAISASSPAPRELGRERGPAGRGDHLRPASRTRWSGRAATRRSSARPAAAPSCSPGLGVDAVCVLPVHARVLPARPRRVRAHRARRAAARRRGRGGGGLPLRPQGGGRRRRCSTSSARSTTTPPKGCRCSSLGRRDDLLDGHQDTARRRRRGGGGAGCSAARTASRASSSAVTSAAAQLGFPTANVESPPHTAIPADGIYAGWLATLDAAGPDERPLARRDLDRHQPDVRRPGTAPSRPTRSTATDLDLYGLHAAIDFAVRLRGTLRFDSVDALVEQMRTTSTRLANSLGSGDPARS